MISFRCFHQWRPTLVGCVLVWGMAKSVQDLFRCIQIIHLGCHPQQTRLGTSFSSRPASGVSWPCVEARFGRPRAPWRRRWAWQPPTRRQARRHGWCCEEWTSTRLQPNSSARCRCTNSRARDRCTKSSTMGPLHRGQSYESLLPPPPPLPLPLLPLPENMVENMTANNWSGLPLFVAIAHCNCLWPLPMLFFSPAHCHGGA